MRDALAQLRSRAYVSIDADLGAGEAMNAVRFLDTIGLNRKEMIEVAETVSEVLEERGTVLSGLDVMEIDVHLADLPGSPDGTVQICAEMVRTLTGKGGEAA